MIYIMCLENSDPCAHHVCSFSILCDESYANNIGDGIFTWGRFDEFVDEGGYF